MTQQTFEEIMECQFERCKNILGQKANEYADNDDRLHNFKIAATIMQCSDQYALGGMLAKHITSIYDMLQNHLTDYPMAQWDEKITDAINYLVLLKAIVNETCEPETSIPMPHVNREIENLKLFSIEDTPNGINFVYKQEAEMEIVDKVQWKHEDYVKCRKSDREGYDCDNCMFNGECLEDSRLMENQK